MQIAERSAKNSNDYRTRRPIIMRQLSMPRKTVAYVEFARHPRPITDLERNHPPIRENPMYVNKLWRSKANNDRDAAPDGHFPRRKPQLFQYRLPDVKTDKVKIRELMQYGEPFPY